MISLFHPFNKRYTFHLTVTAVRFTTGPTLTFCPARPIHIIHCNIWTWKGKGQGKVHPRTGHHGPEGEGSQRHAPASLPPGKAQHPPNRRLGGPQGRSGHVRKISPPPRFDPRTDQPVVSCYTDWVDWVTGPPASEHVIILADACVL
jgi:hypothetical protein